MNIITFDVWVSSASQKIFHQFCRFQQRCYHQWVTVFTVVQIHLSSHLLQQNNDCHDVVHDCGIQHPGTYRRSHEIGYRGTSALVYTISICTSYQQKGDHLCVSICHCILKLWETRDLIASFKLLRFVLKGWLILNIQENTIGNFPRDEV